MGHGLSQVPGPSAGRRAETKAWFPDSHPGLLSRLLLGLWTTRVPWGE